MEDMDLSFHQNLRNAFLDIAKREPERCVVIDAAQGVEAVHQSIIKKVEEKLLKC